MGKFLKISQKLHGNDTKHIKVCKKTKFSKSTDELFFTLCQLQLRLYQNRPMRLALCFVGVHHIYAKYNFRYKNEQYLVYYRMRYYTSPRVFPHAGIHISACISACGNTRKMV